MRGRPVAHGAPCHGWRQNIQPHMSEGEKVGLDFHLRQAAVRKVKGARRGVEVRRAT